MTRHAKCPMCNDGFLTSGEGQLDQSGGTYLPTTVWSCDVCGCVRYDSAKVSAWRKRGEPAAASDVQRAA